MKREPYTEPYTRRERLSIRKELLTYDVRRFFREGIWRRLAWMLPHRVCLWAFIRVAGHAWVATNKPPDELNYPAIYDAWEAKRSKPAAYPGQTLIEVGVFIMCILVGIGVLIYLTT